MTFTLLAVDTAARLIGVATASFSLAVGNAVPALAPDVGAAASQAWTNRRLRHRVISALRGGEHPEAIVDRLPEWDADHHLRQLAVIDRDGRAASVTGAGCSPWAGALVGHDAIAVGNLLAGPGVLEAMIAAHGAGEPDGEDDGRVDFAFAGRLLSALAAGEDAGGDIRGRQSAALQVARFQAGAEFPPELAIDLRSDLAEDPIDDLRGMLLVQGAATPRTG